MFVCYQSIATPTIQFSLLRFFANPQIVFLGGDTLSETLSINAVAML